MVEKGRAVGPTLLHDGKELLPDLRQASLQDLQASRVSIRVLPELASATQQRHVHQRQNHREARHTTFSTACTWAETASIQSHENIRRSTRLDRHAW